MTWFSEEENDRREERRDEKKLFQEIGFSSKQHIQDLKNELGSWILACSFPFLWFGFGVMDPTLCFELDFDLFFFISTIGSFMVAE